MSEPRRRIPVAVDGHDRHRAAVDPHVRDHAARGDRRARSALTGHPLDASRRRLGPRAARRRLGRGSGHRRRAPLPRRHELRPAPGRVVGAIRGLGGRPRHLGRHPLRRHRRRLSSSGAPARASALFADCSRPGCCSPRRSAAGATGGTRSSSARPPTCPGGSTSTPSTARSSTSTSRAAARTNFHPIFLYEFIYNLVGVGRAAARGAARPHPAAGALRPLHLVVHARPALRGAAPHRSFARVPRPAAELLGRRSSSSSARWRSSSGGSSSGSTSGPAPSVFPWSRDRRAGDGRPQGTRPPASLASRGCLHPCWTSTSTRSRDRSTSC